MQQPVAIMSQALAEMSQESEALAEMSQESEMWESSGREVLDNKLLEDELASLV